MAWELELAAEELRRGAPEDWKKFMLALEIEMRNVFGRVLDAPNTELLLQSQGEARAWRNLVTKLANAPETAQRLKGRE